MARTLRPAEVMSASLIGRVGQALSGYPPAPVRCRSRARASLRTRHQGPSIMGPGQLVGRAASHAIPTIYFHRTFGLAGGLITYGATFTDERTAGRRGKAGRAFEA